METPLITLPALPAFHFTFAFSPALLLGILAIFFLLYLVISAVLFYHWTAYGMGSHGILVGETLYVVVSVALLIVAFISASYY